MRSLKKCCACISVILLITSSYGAVITDNDGSAFVTKSEFDALKRSFQTQVHDYNLSIDSKIDGAIAAYLAGIKYDSDMTPEYNAYGMETGSIDGYKVNTFYLTPVIDGYFLNDDVKIQDGTEYARVMWFALSSDEKTERPGKFGSGYWVTGIRTAHPSYTMKGVPPECLGIVVGMLPKSPNGIFYKLSEDWLWDDADWPTYSRKKIEYSELENVYNAYLSDAFNQCIRIYKPSFILYQFWDAGHAVVNIMPVNNGYKYEGGEHGGRDYDSGRPFDSSNKKFWQFCLKHGDTVKRTYPLSDLTFEEMNAFELDVSAGDTFCIEWKKDLEPSGGWNTWRYSLMSFSNQIPGWKVRDKE